MKMYMLVEPLISKAYWCEKYIDGIKKELLKTRSELIITDEADIPQIKRECAESRAVVTVNCISRSWIEDTLKKLNREDIHALLIAPHGEYPFMNVSMIAYDFSRAFFDLCSYLETCGKKKTALFGVNPASANDAIKKSAYISFCSCRNAEPHIYENRGDLRSACESFFNDISAFDSVVCTNDIVAVGLINFLKNRGVGVPRDIYAAALGNSELAKKISPSLTVVDFDCESVGRHCARMYATLSKNPELSSLRASVYGKIIPRESTEFSPCVPAQFTAFPSVINENINFYADGDIKDIFAAEKLLSCMDETDSLILHLTLSGKTLSEIAEEIFLSQSAVKYRLRKMESACGANGKRALGKLFCKYIGNP